MNDILIAIEGENTFMKLLFKCFLSLSLSLPMLCDKRSLDSQLRWPQKHEILLLAFSVWNCVQCRLFLLDWTTLA